MAERDPDTIKKDIDAAREQLASTVDILADRANPRHLAERAKTRAVEIVTKPAVMASLAGIGGLLVVLAIRRVRNR
ncbi:MULTISPECIES: DUF3618 domain-containing protein [Mycobacteriaceae]|uniref:DUF3618 domain-containing protein n=4 Tax=Mycobacteriaceae TaxID=1762 RepID=F5YXB9_MYCSD|nr:MULTISPECIES: DUF3618 domain-containing protein [Mycobacteriaceae]AEF35388.1 conserved hypothetical protein [Mycolicibacter sinensis]OQZ94629.1 hypothetical protein BST10_17900 [Mycolicibacter algericus DSM 45454]BBX11417.1 hypothetical protein MNVM_04980 [Mycobacterium novum]GFG84344.1 hypothetical protein MALGJ_10200 [Mycolicibacter algericus]